MRIFIPRIPKTVTQKQLKHFATVLLDSKFSMPFTAKPKLISCDILKITQGYGSAEHHGLVSITPDSAAQWFIEHARGKILENKRILAREYFERNEDNGNFPEEDDRRDPHATTETMQDNVIQVEALDQFKKEHR